MAASQHMPKEAARREDRDATKNKGLQKKACRFNCFVWLPDLGSNQGPTD